MYLKSNIEIYLLTAELIRAALTLRFVNLRLSTDFSTAHYTYTQLLLRACLPLREPGSAGWLVHHRGSYQCISLYFSLPRPLASPALRLLPRRRLLSRRRR